jgi:2-C-methyl-D-erythritol 4-phosphate cytidylyltransferase
MNIGIIVAAGSGERLFDEIKIKKQYYKLNGYKEVFLHPLETFIEVEIFSTILLVIPKGDKDRVLFILRREEIEDKVIIVEGGDTRQDSVEKAMDYLSNSVSSSKLNEATVFIHDGDRPLVSKDLLNRLLQASKQSDAIIPVMPIFDSMLRKEDKNYVNRQDYLCIHTPQVFKYDLLMKALSYAKITNRTFGDEGSVIQYYGHEVSYVESEISNMKITDLNTLQIVEKWEKIYG